MSEYNYIHVNNLIRALEIAIESVEEHEKQRGYTGKSAFRAGLEMNLDALRKGYSLRIKYDLPVID